MSTQPGFPRMTPKAGKAAQPDLVRHAANLEASGLVGEAERVLRSVVVSRPKDAVAWRELGRVLRNKRDLAGAEDAFRHALKANVRDLEATLQLGALMQQVGRSTEALESYERAIWIDPTDHRAYCGKAIIQEMNRAPDTALTTLETAIARAKKKALAEAFRARVLRRLKRLDEARAEAERLLADPAPGPEVHRRAAYELARILDKQGDYSGAFAAATRANRLQAEAPEAKSVYSTKWFGFVESLGKIKPEFFQRWGVRTFDDGLPTPIFLVGFPRSGTTMLEQLLAAHPAVAVSNEREMLNPACIALTKGLTDTPNVGELFDALPPARILAARKVYHQISEVFRAEKPGATSVVDKYPMNLFLLSLINLVFPQARVLVATRDPRDVCLSCFMQEFVTNTSMVHFLSIEDTARLYDLVMGTWLRQKSILTVPILEVKYETLTSNLEPEARRILEFCGLPWDPAVLKFHEREHQRWVSTPSYESISKPVNTDAQGRWKKYRAGLEPILPKLEPYVQALGYEGTPGI